MLAQVMEILTNSDSPKPMSRGWLEVMLAKPSPIYTNLLTFHSRFSCLVLSHSYHHYKPFLFGTFTYKIAFYKQK